eukprot:CAMPEP_0197833786 /NCGR_PEP_ID=MMETSP1437-20131217/20114_1 /TAXON_ID=49252 ORGANISM="Eucampia antarctica, Strain CCMP1452" /NCGR_SAMPLE_ID=MMETSP1437 /ASSEMBLY_ACC=CAM_ASM_001096 /LENGTH=36 /DNA_ID= /DNA_START= /DNA_END= /DNA_ORIENTATION=
MTSVKPTKKFKSIPVDALKTASDKASAVPANKKVLV